MFRTIDKRASFAIIAAVGLCLLSGSWASLSAPEFYQTMIKPTWAPPAWLFGPVWTVLFIMIACAGLVIWHGSTTRYRRWALILFFMQLLCNSAWSFFFFAWRLGFLAIVDIIILDVLVALLILCAWKNRQQLAALLLLPYFLWILFATVLCVRIYQLNPMQL